MVDVESSGTNPDRHGLLQIACVRFNLLTGAVDQNMFDRSLVIPPWRSWEESTREWWNRQPDVLMDIMSRAEPHEAVMQDLFAWNAPHSHVRFWSKPLSFDFPFVQSYFKDAGYIMPWHYRTARDLNSWVEARYFPDVVPPVHQSDFGAAHNAKVDCLYQIEFLFNHYHNVKRPE